jgi:hypothetical protein
MQHDYISSAKIAVVGPSSISAIGSAGRRPRTPISHRKDQNPSGSRLIGTDPPLVVRRFAWSVRLNSRAQGIAWQCIAIWGFDWLDADDSIPQTQLNTNMFGIQLGIPHRISTMFGFQTVDDYYSVTALFAEIGLVNLSDKHVHPKGSIPTVALAR